MKRGAKLAVLGAALAVLVGAWLLAGQLNRRQAQQAVEAAGADPIDLAPGAQEDLTALSWDYFGDTVSLQKKDGVWVNADDGTCPIDQTAVEPMVQAVADAKATQVIEDVTDFAQYGLEDPSIAVAAATADKTVSYELGDQTAEGGWYVRLNGEDKVYVEQGRLAIPFSAGINDVLDMEAVPEDVAQVTGLAVKSQVGDYVTERLEDPAAVWYGTASQWFLLDEAGEPARALDTDKAEELADLAAQIRLFECADWNMTDPAAYGLDQPQAAVRVTYRDQDGAQDAFSLEFGDYTDGDVYVRFAGSRMVYTVSGLTLDGLMYPDFDGMEDLSPCALDWDGLDTATFTADGQSYAMEHHVSVPTEEGEEPEDIYILLTEDSSQLRSLDPDSVDYWLDMLYTLKADSRVAEAPVREELFSFTFRQDNGNFPTVTAVFTAYSSTDYLCTVNGTERYLVSRTAADSVARAAQAAMTPPEQTETD